MFKSPNAKIIFSVYIRACKVVMRGDIEEKQLSSIRQLKFSQRCLLRKTSF